VAALLLESRIGRYGAIAAGLLHLSRRRAFLSRLVPHLRFLGKTGGKGGHENDTWTTPCPRPG
jgi:hypothetical protein